MLVGAIVTALDGEHRLLLGGPRGDHERPGVPRRPLRRARRRPPARAEGRPDDGPHHLRLGPVAGGEVRRTAATPTGDDWHFGPDFAVEHYLHHQGESFLGRFDALTYLYLTRLLDYFDPFADPWTADRLATTDTRFQLTSFDSDWRFDTTQSVRMAEQLEACGVKVDHAELSSPHGHDSFLLAPRATTTASSLPRVVTPDG